LDEANSRLGNTTPFEQFSFDKAQKDPEMDEFVESMNQPMDKPKYRREFAYDFKKYRAKRTSCPF